jgi:hypothetical protein
MTFEIPNWAATVTANTDPATLNTPLTAQAIAIPSL